MSCRVFLAWTLILTAAAMHIFTARAQVYEGKELVRASLLANRTAFVPGQSLQLGVLLELAEGWHVYWRNPGDAGMPVSLEWAMPPGFVAGGIQWPVPNRIEEPGDLFVFGYKGQVLLPVEVTVPPDLQGEEATLSLRASWLVCEKLCLPGSADLWLTLPVASIAEPMNSELFEAAMKRLPQSGEPPFTLSWEVVKNQEQPTPQAEDSEQKTITPAGPGLRLLISQAPEWADEADFFPFEGAVPEPGHAKPAPVRQGRAELFVPTQVPLRGLLVLEGNWQRAAWDVASPEFEMSQAAAEQHSPPSAAEAAAESIKKPEVVEVSAAERSAKSMAHTRMLLLALFSGFLGGFILNFMPCVLPVISLKIFGFIQQAGESKGRILAHGLAFFAGMCVWFLGLGVVVVLLRAGGTEVTWAFQFQNPWFMLAISAVVFVFALNLFGVFELALPGAAVSKLDEAASAGSPRGAFLQGMFATLLATPCTAPFLGTALGFAFSQPAGVVMAMFAAIALGMGWPYVMLAARPGWMQFLPRPGAWMERLKQFMGFPLLATLLWLLSVIGGQKGVAGIIWTGAILLCLGLACWIYGAFCCHGAARTSRWVAAALALLCAVAGSWFFGTLYARAEPPETIRSMSSPAQIQWMPYSRALLDQLLDAGKPVFVDFTADWCITCKVNERLALETPGVRTLLAEKQITPLKADWTRSDPEITAALAEFGRVGVPFYVFYPAGRNVPPLTFPEILTEALVISKIQEGLETAARRAEQLEQSTP